MQEMYSRMELLLGREKTEVLAKARIAVFGLGAAGASAAVALARCGVASLTLVDDAVLEEPDIGCHVAAFLRTMGESKVQAVRRLIREMDESILVHTCEFLYSEETERLLDFRGFDYIVDAMDQAAPKLRLIRKARLEEIPMISCMDVNHKTDPARLEITDISRTIICPMAREIRAGLRKYGVHRVKVLYSRERPLIKGSRHRPADIRQAGHEQGSIFFLPAAAGQLLAAEAVKDLLMAADKEKKRKH
ncbi:MAG: ThiF family adenylyltransferase [Blautia sp.]|nr:ThiF family adenylyltransferase [Blautia sp.]